MAVTVVGNYQIGYVPVVTDDPISSLYPVFTVGANDDEFNDSNFSGWTTVNSGSFIPTIIESNHVASIVHPGGGGDTMTGDAILTKVRLSWSDV